MHTVLRTRNLVIVGLLAVAASACTTESDDVVTTETAEDIASAIELDDGGLDMTDEAPLFGRDAEFAASDLLAPEADVADDMEQDAEVRGMREAPDVVLFATAIAWGQIPGDASNREPYNWSGTISVNRGALLVKRAVRFEGPDAIAPRTDRLSVSFRSVTGPHHDGLHLLLIDPTPLADEPLVLTYETAGGATYSVPVRALLDGPITEQVDDNGNQIVAVAMARPVDVCENGFIAGRWHKVEDGRGRLLGRVMSSDGELLGHMRGVYGQRDNGDQVFFGKYINVDGQFRGLFRGRYEDGHFRGRWITRAGERGALGGQYRETIPGPEVGGKFLGRWAERTCQVETGPGTDMPSDVPPRRAPEGDAPTSGDDR